MYVHDSTSVAIDYVGIVSTIIIDYKMFGANVDVTYQVVQEKKEKKGKERKKIEKEVHICTGD